MTASRRWRSEGDTGRRKGADVRFIYYASNRAPGDIMEKEVKEYKAAMVAIVAIVLIVAAVMYLMRG